MNCGGLQLNGNARPAGLNGAQSLAKTSCVLVNAWNLRTRQRNLIGWFAIFDTETITAVVSRLKLIAPQFKDVAEDTLTLFATDALTQATADEIPTAQLQLAASLYAAHLATISQNQNNNVSKEQVSTLSREFFDRGGSSDYLAEYKRLVKSYRQTTLRFM